MATPSTTTRCSSWPRGARTTREIVGEGTAEFGQLSEAVIEVAQLLAQAIVRDGEGATKFITITVDEGATREECLRVGKRIANSAAGEDRLSSRRTRTSDASSPQSATPESPTSIPRRSAFGSAM
jgi:hypothetical protein